MSRYREELLRIPPELEGLVVSQPALELPRVTAPDVKATTELHLAGKKIEKLWGFAPFVNLEVLWVNRNRLRELDNLDSNFRISRLYAQDNRIDTLAGSLLRFKFLRVLNLANNSLADLDICLETLKKLEFLRDLDLRGNPAAQEIGYRGRVIAALPWLETLDKVPVRGEERDASIKANRRKRTRVPASPLRSAGRGVMGMTAEARAADVRIGELRSRTFGRKTALHPDMIGTGKAVTEVGRPLYGHDGDTLLTRTMIREAKTIQKKREREKMHRDALAMGGGGEHHHHHHHHHHRHHHHAPIKSALTNSLPLADSMIERAVGRSMLERGCDESDLRRSGIGVYREMAKLNRRAMRRGTGGVVVVGRDKKGGSGLESRASSSRPSSARPESAYSVADPSLRLPTAPVEHELGALSEWDKIKLREVFEEADADSSGTLTVDEMLGAMRASADIGFCLSSGAESSVRDLFARLDEDGSGEVDWREFSEAVSHALRRLEAAASGSDTGSESEETDSEEESDIEGETEDGGSSLRSGKSGRSGKTSASARSRLRPSKRAVIVPEVRFRPLERKEAKARSDRLFARAKAALDEAMRLPPGDEERERKKAEARNLGARATKLHELSLRLEGRFDPPERPPTPPPQRRDFYTVIAAVPEREARKTLQRGNRHYNIPPPGEESDSDTDEEGERGEGEKWERYRKRSKARKPHVIHKRELNIGGLKGK